MIETDQSKGLGRIPVHLKHGQPDGAQMRARAVGGLSIDDFTVRLTPYPAAL
jgi:hypothetical protein